MLIVNRKLKSCFKIRLVTFMAAVFAANSSGGQTPGISFDEILWAFVHPVAAVRVKKTARQCDRIFKTVDFGNKLDTFSAGGKADAFRHIFYMSAFAQKIHHHKLRKLGRAHERHNYRQFRKSVNEDGERSDSLSTVMDLRNNETGFAIGCKNRQISLDSLKNFVIAEIRGGKAWIMRRSADGKYLDCDNVTIDISRYRNRWYVPKCLTRSDFIYLTEAVER